MGGVSVQDLMRDWSFEKGDPIELILQDLDRIITRKKAKDEDEDEDEEDYISEEEDEYATIVGTELHGPTFDGYEEESREVCYYHNPTLSWI